MKGRKSKTLDCRMCGDPVENCGADSISAVCSNCVIKHYWGPVTHIHESEIIASERDGEVFARAIIEPAEPNDALKNAAEKYKDSKGR